MQTITLDPELVATIDTLQTASPNDLQEAVRTRANDAVRHYLRQLTDLQLDAAQRTFVRLHPTLVKSLLGQYVAILNEAVIDTDPDERTLYIRVYQNNPSAVIGIFPVQETADLPVLDFVGFRRN